MQLTSLIFSFLGIWQSGGKAGADKSLSGVPLLTIGKLSGGKGGVDGKSPRRSGGFPSSPLGSPAHHNQQQGFVSPPTPPPPPPAVVKESPRLRTNTHKFAADFEKLQVLSDRRRSCAPNTIKPIKP